MPLFFLASKECEVLDEKKLRFPVLMYEAVKLYDRQTDRTTAVAPLEQRPVGRTAVDSSSDGRRVKRVELPQQDRRSCKICFAQAVLSLLAVGPPVLPPFASINWRSASIRTGNIIHIIPGLGQPIVTADETWVHSEPETKRQFWNGTVSGQGHGQSVATVKE